ESQPDQNEQRSHCEESDPQQKEQRFRCEESDPDQKEQRFHCEESQPEQADKPSDTTSEPEPEALAARETLEETPISNTPLIPIPVLLAVSVILFCLAGIAGISSRWAENSALEKLLSVGCFSLIFFGAFALAHYKLKIPNSAKAFYILGVAALGITLTAAELFGLFLGEAGIATQLLLPTLLISGGMFFGYRIFKTPLFPILGTVVAYLFLIALSAAIFDSAAMVFFIPALVSTGALIYVSLSKKENPAKLRKPALVLFLVFALLSAFASPALASQLHQVLMVTFALLLVAVMHIQTYQAPNRFIDAALPPGLTWAALLFSIKLCDHAPAALYICSTVQCASAAATAFCARKHGKTPGAPTIILQTVGILIVWITMAVGYSYRINAYAHADLIRCGALVLPSLLFLILGARLILKYRTQSTPAAETTEAKDTPTETDEAKDTATETAEAKDTTTETAETKDTEAQEATESDIAATDKAKAKDIAKKAKAKLSPAVSYGADAWLSLLASFIFFFFCYNEAPHGEEAIIGCNTAFSVGLLALALIPERFHIGSLRARQFTVFPLLICLAIAQYIILEDIYYNRSVSVLQSFEFNQLFFLIPAFALAVYGRHKALQREDKNFALAAHVAAVGIILWIFPLLLAILDFAIPAANLKPLILPADMLLLAVILFYEPKSPLCPNLGKARFACGMLLVGLSYLIASAKLPDFVHPLLIDVMPWLMATGYVAFILFYTFRKRVACADAPHQRRMLSFSLFVVLAFVQFILRKDLYNPCSLLTAFQTNQLFFLLPAFALAVIEYRKAIQRQDKSWALAAQVSAACAILWIFPLLVVLLDYALPVLDLKPYILPSDMLLLTVILLHEPKSPLCPNLSMHRLVAGTVLTGISYILTVIALDETTLAAAVPWTVTGCYAAFILFYTFRKRIAFADAPHMRVRTALALFTVMSLVQIYPNTRIAAVMLLAALGLAIVDDRRSAALAQPKDQTIAAILGSVLTFGLIALVVIALPEFIPITSATHESVILKHTLSAAALLCALAVLAEHLAMGKKETRPYRLVAAVDLEVTAALALLYQIIDMPGLPSRVMLLAAGLIATACFSWREHKKYGVFAALAVFTGIYSLLKSGWINLETTEPDYFVWIATAILTAALAFADGFKRPGYTHLRAAWILAAWPLIIVHNDPYHVAHLAGVLIIALNLLQYLRERGKCDHDRTLITISAGIIGLALPLKILMLPEDSWLPVMIRPELIFLIPMATAYIISWFVWKFREPSHDICSVAALVCLPMLYLIPSQHVLFHAVTTTVLAIAAILLALRTKLNRYLFTGLISILIIFFSQTGSFWLSLHWWVYLAVVAVILLAIAVINETERRKGSTFAALLKGLIARAWKW
ncbi:MAG: hypothetical protein II767_09410, partial [Proteobacteria bacterium]|nr:hypothetical protein [Pseudomonadota bacterium]